MTITGAIVLYAVTWFMVFFVVLPIRFTSQADAGSVVPGTPRSAPSTENVGKKARVTTIFATVLWAIICGIILSGWITVEDLDWFDRSRPVTAQP
jgi:predicted secreted protein